MGERVRGRKGDWKKLSASICAICGKKYSMSRGEIINPFK